ncbi:MAG: Uma2 family endonuclease [Candidatus Latescibacterota bacterium]
MHAPYVLTDSPSLTLRMGPVLRRVSDEEFLAFCRQNPDWRFEMSSEGDLIIMAPTGSRTGRQNLTLAGIFYAWCEADGTGVGFDSSAGFTLPNGARRSPDLAWVRNSRWDALTEAEQEVFAPLCPDFVVELRSPSDSLDALHAKMREYMENGAQLGWLIDPLDRRVHVYRPCAAPVCLDEAASLSGDPVLPGFVLDCRRVWDA